MTDRAGAVRLNCDLFRQIAEVRSTVKAAIDAERDADERRQKLFGAVLRQWEPK